MTEQITNSTNNPFGLSLTLMLAFVIIWLITFLIGFYLIRHGTKQGKTWKIILGVIFTGLIGLVYYLILRERIKAKEAKEAVTKSAEKISDLKKEKDLK